MDFNVSSGRKKAAAASGGGGGGGAELGGGAWGGVGTGAGGGRGRGGSSSQLAMYSEPPTGVEVSVEEFEEFALDRLRVLKTLEEAKARGRKLEEVDNLVQELWRKHIRVAGSTTESARKDIISHFVLRLAYCRTEELRRWFLAQESSLFRHRFRAETADSQRRFLEEHGLPYRAISSAELDGVREQLAQVARSINQPVPSADAVFYKVPFEEVPELVAGRRVLLRQGFAFVPREQLAAIVVGHFRSLLSKALVLTNRKWLQHIQEDERDRLTPIVEGLSSRYLGEDYSDPAARGRGVVNLQDVDSLARHAFPMCMRHLFFKLREDHHLKHGGRMQLGLFLKGIGLRLEDALTFWRAEFSIKMGSERFEKEYSYTIRHNYGKEGKRTDYTPFSCAKIISATPGVGDHHGCPFKHFSEDNLRALLGRVGVPAPTVGEVVDKTRNHHYQISCAMVFESTQRKPCLTGIMHPNQYFDLAMGITPNKASNPAEPAPTSAAMDVESTPDVNH